LSSDSRAAFGRVAIVNRGETAMRPRAGQPAPRILCCMHRTRRARSRRLNTQP